MAANSSQLSFIAHKYNDDCHACPSSEIMNFLVFIMSSLVSGTRAMYIDIEASLCIPNILDCTDVACRRCCSLKLSFV